MSEQLFVCQALAAMMRDHGELNEDEVRFVGHAAFDLGLAPEENEAVQKVLKEGGEYYALLEQITSKPMRSYLFRRVVTATLLDDQINAEERAFITKTGEAFGYEAGVVEEYIAWITEGIEWEKRGAELQARL